MKPITFTPEAAKSLGRLPTAVCGQLRDKLHRYAQTGAGDVRSLTGRPGTRLRSGDYRIIFVETADAITVLAVGHRRDIYE